MPDDRVVVVDEHRPRRRRRRRVLVGAHVAVLASIALTSGALAGSGSSSAGTTGTPGAAQAQPPAGAPFARSGHHCHHDGARGARSRPGSGNFSY
jgi:hypothetical protein